MQMITIVTIVDVIGALSKGELQDNIYMVDNSWDSVDKGTSELTTACYPGQKISWVVYSIDVQTPALITSIEFLSGKFFSSEREPVITQGSDTEHRRLNWAGIVPSHLLPGHYRYRLTLQMGRGSRSSMSVDTPTLNVLPILEHCHEPTVGNHTDD